MISGKLSGSNHSGSQQWAGRTSGEVADITIAIGESISLDIQLYREDIRGSVAHARMLCKIGVLRADELHAIEHGLLKIRAEIEAGEMQLQPELEDIHTHIENRLTNLIGEAGKKLHTARSRNDQVAVDTHLFVRKACHENARLNVKLLQTLLERASQTMHMIVPGYTHLQVAQPIRLAHHLLAHFWNFEKSLQRLEYANRQALRLPLGSGAMAGVNYATDREFLRVDLGFDRISPNSMEAVASRDHILDFLYAATLWMSHASRICEEIILWNSVEFGFISLPDALTTGSSIMPQKKNPDLAELVRGKFGRTLGHLQNVLVTLKGLPLTYNRDLQEDRLPLLDTHQQWQLSLQALEAMLAGVVFHPERMRMSLETGFAAATDLADALVHQKSISFRDAHHLVGALVGRASKLNMGLSKLPLDERIAISEHFADENFYTTAVDLSRSADRKISPGGTALPMLKEQLNAAKSTLQNWQAHDWQQPDLNFEVSSA